MLKMNSFLTVFLLVLWWAQFTSCANIQPFFTGLQMGIGADYIVGRTFGTALESRDSEIADFGTGQQTEWKITQIKTNLQLQQALGMSSSWAIKSLIGPSASSVISFAESANINSFSTFLLVKASVKNPARNIPMPDLRQRALDFLGQSGLEGFERYFGSNYLGGVVSGGMYLGMITVHTKTETEKRNIVRGVKFSGFGTNVELDLSSAAENIMKNRRVEVYGVQIGGQSQSLATTVSDMVQQLKAFPTQVIQYPVPIEGIFHKYQDTIPADWLGQGQGTDYYLRDTVLQALGNRILNLKDTQNNLQYVQNNYNSFEALVARNSSQKNSDLKQISNEINKISVEINEINKIAVKCVANTDECFEPQSNYAQTFTLPKYPDDELSESVGMGLLFFGAFEDIPYGWQLCNGSNGTPDLRGRFPVGYTNNNDYGNGSRVTTNQLGQSGGFTTKQLSVSEMPQHKHTIDSAGSHSHSMNSAGSHSHGFRDFITAYQSDYPQQCNKKSPNPPGSWRSVQAGYGTSNEWACYWDTNTNSAGSHSHSINSAGSHSHSENWQGSSQSFDIINPYASIFIICKTK